jgi:hypothetical protein
MSELTPKDMARGTAKFDGKSLAISDPAHIIAPDTAAPTAPGQTGPYVVTGLQWITDPRPAAATQNAFDVSLTGAVAVRLAAERMNLDATQPILGSVGTENPLALRVDGGWTASPTVTVDDAPVSATLADGVLEIPVPAGLHTVVITPPETVVTRATDLAFTDASDDSAQYSDTATLEARLTGPEDDALAGETVTFSLGDATASAVTDAAGVASATLPVTEAPGESSATVSFGGREGELDPSLATTPFLVTEDDSTVALTSTDQGNRTQAEATLTDADSGAGLAGRTIHFFLDGNEVATAVTDAAGHAVAEFSNKKTKKSAIVRAVFDTDGYYKGASAERPRRVSS